MLKIMLSSFKLIIKNKLYSLLYQYSHFIKTRHDLEQVREYLNDIVNEIIEEYSKENHL